MRLEAHALTRELTQCGVQALRQLMQRRQRVDDVHNEDVCGEDDDVHREADAQEVAEAVSARAVDQHVGGRADGRGEAAAHADHQGD